MDDLVERLADLLPHIEKEVGRAQLESDLEHWILDGNDDGSPLEVLADRYAHQYGA